MMKPTGALAGLMPANETQGNLPLEQILMALLGGGQVENQNTGAAPLGPMPGLHQPMTGRPQGLTPAQQWPWLMGNVGVGSER